MDGHDVDLGDQARWYQLRAAVHAWGLEIRKRLLRHVQCDVGRADVSIEGLFGGKGTRPSLARLVTFRTQASVLGRTRGAEKRPAIDIINTLAAAQSAGRLQRAMSRYQKIRLLIVDELGYLPID